MKKDSVPFNQLPFSKLFQDYINGKANHFFDANPFDDDSIKNKAEAFKFKGDRAKVVSILTDFNEQFEAPTATLNQIQKFSEPNTFAVVTGQQLTIYGGPLFTIYKTLTAIIYSRKWSKLLKCPVVPVFWLADEDHDIEEAVQFKLPNRDLPVTIPFSIDNDRDHPPPVGQMELGESYKKFKHAVLEELDTTDFSESLWSALDDAYGEDITFREAFGRWLLNLFGEEGLVLAGSFYEPVKDLSKSVFQKSIEDHKEISELLDSSTYQLISEGYHGQVQVQESNLFYIRNDKGREKITYTDESWKADDSVWSGNELVNEMDTNPERFSPNVFLRPIVQDQLLPTIGYVAGPGETAYYAQMKELYTFFELSIPVIIPRFSITLVESSIERIIGKLPFEITEYNQRIEDLEKQFITKTESTDIEKFFGIWKNQIQELTEFKKDTINEIDPSLTGSVGKAKAVYFTELDKLKGKVYRSVKQQEEIQLSRISKIQTNLYPDGNLQEREIAFIYYMNKYGLDIWKNLSEILEEELPKNHKVIYL